MRRLLTIGFVALSLAMVPASTVLGANWNRYFQEYMDSYTDNTPQKNIELLDKSIALDSGRTNFQAYEKRAEVLSKLGRYDEALQAIEQYIAFQNLFYSEWGNKANANTNNAKEYNACKWFQKNLCLQRRESYCQKAVIQFRLGRYDDALVSWNKALQFEDEGMRMMGKPTDRNAYLNGRATILAKMDRTAEAVADFDTYIAYKKLNSGSGENKPGETQLKLALEKALVFKECGLYEPSITAFNTVIANLSKDSDVSFYVSNDFVKIPFLHKTRDVYILCAQAKEKAGRDNDALTDYGSIITQFGKSDATVYKYRAQYYERHRAFTDAQQDYDAAVSMSRNSKNSLLLRAAFFERQKKLKEAEADYVKIAESDSLPLASFYLRTGQSAKAKAQLDLAVEKANKQTYYFDGGYRPHVQRALYYSSVGKYPEAIADLNKAEAVLTTEIDRRTAASAKYRAEHGLASLERYLNNDDWDRLSVWLKLARVHEDAGRLDAALQQLDRIAAIAPNQPSVIVAKARVKEKQGNLAEALQDFQKIPLSSEGTELKLTVNEPTGDFLLNNKLASVEAAMAVGNFSAAEKSVTELLTEQGETMSSLEQAQLLLQRAAAYSKKLDHIKALEDVERAQSLEPALGKQAKILKNKILVALGREPEPETPAKQTASATASEKIATTSTIETKRRTSDPNAPIKDKWALVIGISKFANPEYNLKYAAKDARDFYNYLITDGKFQKDHVMLLLDEQATRVNIMSAFGSKFLPAVTKEGDLVVVYVSTHGTPANRDAGNKNFIVAYDTSGDALYETGVNMDELYSRVKAGVKTDRALIVMDTCYSGGGLPGAKGVEDFDNFDATEIAQGFGHLVISSSSPSERSWESKVTANGVFTKYLIQNLKLTQGNVKAAFDKVQNDVGWEVQNAFNKKQHPQIGGEWEGKELRLSAPATEHRPILNPELMKMLNLNKATASSPVLSGPARTLSGPTKAPSVQANVIKRR